MHFSSCLSRWVSPHWLPGQKNSQTHQQCWVGPPRAPSGCPGLAGTLSRPTDAPRGPDFLSWHLHLQGGEPPLVLGIGCIWRSGEGSGMPPYRILGPTCMLLPSDSPKTPLFMLQLASKCQVVSWVGSWTGRRTLVRKLAQVWSSVNSNVPTTTS